MIIGISGYAGSGKDTIGRIIQYLLCSDSKPSIEEVLQDVKLHDWWLEDQSKWELKKFAFKLKLIGEILTGINMEKFEDQEFKKTKLGPEWNTYGIVRKDGTRQLNISTTPYDQDNIWLKDTENKQVTNVMTVRDFLQKLGTDGLRNGLHSDVWVNALFADYQCIPADLVPNGWDCPNWIITDVRFKNEAQAIKSKGGIIIRVDRPGFKPINDHPSETEIDDWNFDYKIANVSDIVSLMFTVENVLKHAKILK